MSARERQKPVWVIDCDHKHCGAVFVPEKAFDRLTRTGARWAAGVAGWQVRPNGGKGSMSAPDFCPQHRKDGQS